MNDIIPINLAVEDDVSEAVLKRMFASSGRQYSVGSCFGHFGFGFLKKRIGGFNNAAKGTPFLILTDLDRKECAPILIQEWLRVPMHHNLLFRVAVRTVESWLLADRASFAAFLGIRKEAMPRKPDDLDDPKRTLIELTGRSRKRELREAIIPKARSTAKVGPDYNSALIRFVQKNWNVREAVRYSPSLKRAYDAIISFSPVTG